MELTQNNPPGILEIAPASDLMVRIAPIWT